MTELHLGINVGHDRAAAVVAGGEVLVAIEEERRARQVDAKEITMKNVTLLIGLAMLTLGSSVATQEKPPLPTEVVELIEKAKAGDAVAQALLGKRYVDGKGVTKDDKEAVKWWRKAAKQNNARAQYGLGIMYDTGRGVLEDDKEAVKWYRKAAEQGYAAAQFELGVMYANGEGVPEDDKEAVKWYRKAAEQGDAKAQSNLGLMYSAGRGVLEDVVMAYAWYNIAGANGNSIARENKSKLAKRMTKEQMAESQKLSRKLYDEIEKRKSKGN